MTREFPQLPGWVFTMREICNGGWEVSGRDRAGRSVSKQGDDPEQLLDACKAYAATLRVEVMNDCDALPAAYPESGLAELPEFASRLEQISIDPVNWVRILRCRNCGQLWEESYRSTGHGEVATTRKFSSIKAWAGVNRRERLQRSRNCAAGESDTGTTKPASHLR
jgi:hypothetical protein